MRYPFILALLLAAHRRIYDPMFYKLCIALLLVVQLLAYAQSPEKVAYGKTRAYPNSIQGEPVWVKDRLEWNKIVQKKVEHLAKGILSKEQLNELNPFIQEYLSTGSCVGQSFVFLLAHPPSQKKLKRTPSSKQLQQILLFQFGEYARRHWYEKGEVFLAAARDYLKLYHPEEVLSEDELIENGQLLIDKEIKQIKKGSQQFEQLRSVAKTYKTFLAFGKFDRVFMEIEDSLLKDAGLKKLPSRKIWRDEKDPSGYYCEFLEAVADLYKNHACTDLFISYDAAIEGKKVGHRFLVQLEHCRIYDPACGIYHYDNLVQLIQDVGKFLDSVSENTYFRLCPVTEI